MIEQHARGVVPVGSRAGLCGTRFLRVADVRPTPAAGRRRCAAIRACGTRPPAGANPPRRQRNALRRRGSVTSGSAPMATSSAMGSSPGFGADLARVLFGVGQRLPQAPVDRGGRQPQNATRVGRRCPGRYWSRCSGPASASRVSPEMDENRTKWRTGFFSDNRCNSAAASSLGANMAVTSSSVISLSKHRRTGEGRQVDSLQRRQVGAEPVEQRAHRGFVGRIGGYRRRGSSRSAARLSASSSQALTGIARHRDDRSWRPSGRVAGSGAARCCRSPR